MGVFGFLVGCSHWERGLGYLVCSPNLELIGICQVLERTEEI
jgi:hypothetical protein